MALHVGLALPNQHLRSADQFVCLNEQIQIVRRARDLGWDSVWGGQHFLMSEFSMLQPIPYLSRLAAESGNMQLGLGISLLALLNPVQVAEDLASLDVISEGRLIAGFGLGYRDLEYGAFGLSKIGSTRRFEDNLDALKRLWAGESGIELPWCSVPEGELSVLPRQQPRPQIWMAAHSDKAVLRAARTADAWYISPHVTLSTVSRQMKLYREARRSSGLSSSVVPIAKEIFCARTTEEAIATGGPFITGKYDAYAAWGQDQVLPEDVSFRDDLESLSQGRFVIGSPELCRQQLAEVVTKVQPSHLVLRVHWPAMPLDVALSSLELLSAEVVPALRDL